MNWTATAASKEFGVSRETVIRGLRGIGLEVKHSSKFSTRDVHRALSGDFKQQRVRETRARADLYEMELREKERELIPMEEARGLLTGVLSQVRQRFIALPAELASRTNPTDPAFARAALEAWRDEALKVCRENI